MSESLPSGSRTPPHLRMSLADIVRQTNGASGCRFCACNDFRVISKNADGHVTECCRKCKRGVRTRYEPIESEGV